MAATTAVPIGQTDPTGRPAGKVAATGSRAIVPEAATARTSRVAAWADPADRAAPVVADARTSRVPSSTAP